MNRNNNPVERVVRRRAPPSIRTKLAVYFSALTAATVSGVLLVSMLGLPFGPYGGRLALERSRAFRHLDLIADLKKAQLLRWVEERYYDAGTFAGNVAVSRDLSSLRSSRGSAVGGGHGDVSPKPDTESPEYQSLVRQLRRFVYTHRLYDAVAIADMRTGTIIVSTDSADLGENISHQSCFKQAVGSFYPSIGDIRADARSGAPTVHISRVVEDEHGMAIGVLRIQVMVDDFIRPMLHTGEGLGKSGEALLVNDRRQIIASLKHPLPDGRVPTPLEYEIDAMPARLAARGDEGIIESYDYRGEQVLAAYRHISVGPDWGWGLVVTMDKAELYGPMWRETFQKIGVGLIATLAVVLVGVALARKISAPLRELSETASKVTAGDLDSRAPVMSDDEVGRVAENFNAMVESLQYWHVELEERVRARTVELSTANESLQAEIAARQQAMDELASSEARYQDLYDNSPDMYASVDARTASVVQCNQTLSTALGYAKYEIVGKPVSDLYDPACLAQAEEAHRLIAATGEVHPSELWLRRKDGSNLVVSLSASARRSDSGRVLDSRLAWRDITERREIEEALRGSEARYRALFDTMLNGFALHEIIVDEENRPYDYRFLEVNPAFETLTGLRAADVAGKTVREVLPALEPAWIDTYGAVALSGTSVRFEDYTAPLGKHFEVLAFSPKEGQFATVFSDVTERTQAERTLRRALEDLERSNGELEQFAYVASHDLREPLRMVTSYTQLLARRYEGELGEDADEFIRFAVDGATRMQKLIDDLLDYSRVGRSDAPVDTVDCRKALNNVLVDMKRVLDENEATVSFGDLPTVRGNGRQLERLFQNLIGNSIKFRTDEAPRIDIVAELMDAELLFSVRDNGVGIESSHLHRIFVIFQRLHGAEDYPGTGIGLAICKRIVEYHGGRIWAESEPGNGTVVHFTIPAAECQEGI